MQRLDKVLSNLGYGSRKEIKVLVKNGEVEVEGNIVKSSSMKVNPEKDVIKVSGEEINYRKYIYIMMNKPSGVISATFDNYDETVIDLLDYSEIAFSPFPVGRLDKDTEGLLLITNDGILNHRLTSPKWHVNKIYYAEINLPVTKEDVDAFEKGITLDDGYKCMPAKMEIVNSNDDGSEVYVTVQEGKYHQVKRMFEALEKKVIYLKRIKIGELDLDKDLQVGDYRELSKEELKNLKEALEIK